MRLHRCQSKFVTKRTKRTERNEREKRNSSSMKYVVRWAEGDGMEVDTSRSHSQKKKKYWTSSSVRVSVFRTMCLCMPRPRPSLTPHDSMIRQINHSQKASSHTILHAHENTAYTEIDTGPSETHTECVGVCVREKERRRAGENTKKCAYYTRHDTKVLHRQLLTADCRHATIRSIRHETNERGTNQKNTHSI